MTRNELNEAVRKSPSVREWWLAMVQYPRFDNRRDKARYGLRAAIRQTVGLEHEVKVTDGADRMDIEVTIDDVTKPIDFYF